MQRPSRDLYRLPIGVVLAGGASRRFGSDKAMVEIEGSSLVRRAAERLSRVCSEVVIADAGRSLLDGKESIADGPGRGPAAGILGAAARFPGRALLVLACDLPAVPSRLLQTIVTAIDPNREHDLNQDLVMARTSRGVEPLCALYGPKALERIARRVSVGDFALHPLAADAELEPCFIDAEDEHLLNVNRPEDLDSLIQESSTDNEKNLD